MELPGEPRLNTNDMEIDFKGSRGDTNLSFFNNAPQEPGKNHSDSVYALPSEEVSSALEDDLADNESELQMPANPS